jgi:hypothetical protein
MPQEMPRIVLVVEVLRVDDELVDAELDAGANAERDVARHRRKQHA